MNLSPTWGTVLTEAGWDTVHWAEVGPMDASDETIMEWARDHEYVVVTNDLDFGAIIAATDAGGPSVVQIRAQDLSPQAIAQPLLNALEQAESALRQGAIISVDVEGYRLRTLPLRRPLSPSH